MKEYKPLFITATAEAALAIIDGVDGTGAEVLPLDNPENMAAFMEYQEDRAPVLLAFDRTEEGKDAAARIRKAAPEGWPIWNTAGSLCGEYDTITNAAKKDADSFRRNIAEALLRLYEVADAAGYFDKPEKPPEQPKTPAEILQDFRKTIASRKYEPIKTGIPAVDRMFGGGLIRGTLVTLQAAPGMGKTTLAQWIFENMAAAGQDVLYINLEMDREQLLARSIARIAWRNYNADFDALDVLRAYQFENDTIAQDVIDRSIEDYTTTTAPRLTYNPEALQNKDGTQSNHIDRIMDAIQKEADRVEKAGRPTPIICIDYLQIIKTDQRDTAEGVKEVIHRLKDFAARPGHQTTVFLITAQNRAANSQGEAEQESGRDTSDIEYTADVMLAITYTAIEDHEKFTVEDAKGNTKSIEYTLKEIRRLAKQAYTTGRDLPEVCKRYTLKVNKHRFAASGKNVKLIFDGRHSMFETVKTWDRNAEGPVSGAQRVGMKKK